MLNREGIVVRRKGKHNWGWFLHIIHTIAPRRSGQRTMLNGWDFSVWTQPSLHVHATCRLILAYTILFGGELNAMPVSCRLREEGKPFRFVCRLTIGTAPKEGLTIPTCAWDQKISWCNWTTSVTCQFIPFVDKMEYFYQPLLTFITVISHLPWHVQERECWQGFQGLWGTYLVSGIFRNLSEAEGRSLCSRY